MRHTLLFHSCLALAFAANIGSAAAGVFTAIRIGDVDGFGYGNAAGFQGADGAAANRTGGVLSTGDLLPDLNRNGVLATGNGDDFDNRSVAEVSGSSVTGSGFIDNGSTGAQYTDIALSQSYDRSSSRGLVYNADSNTSGAGGAFPNAPSNSLPNQPGFVFDYSVAVGDILDGTDVFLNLVFGDYDVTPANVQVTFADNTSTIVSLTRQAGKKDGLVQSAYAVLEFNKVYTTTVAGFDGYAKVDFNAANEPYTAFDFVELSVEPIALNSVPEPTTLAVWTILSGLGLVSGRRSRHNKSA
ncbi:hypothetical protein [Aureliella helgolandensis]|uniref:PEP-CTERM protein-sorting domain-containing protein n=1 Tax=Aureliella helgolandensis TaxID=2527968 RepID=A0A518GFH4_9BACT|nr:hypothetical protein [Aureliella helgolandensis]QDV27351.1 hypothetical protein Q31a_57390 [Aureliella helgolandensis]